MNADHSKAEIVSKMERIVKIFTIGNSTVYTLKKITDSTFVMTHKTNDDFGITTVPGTSLLVGIITTRYFRLFFRPASPLSITIVKRRETATFKGN